MLQIIRAEEEEEWLNYEYYNVEVRNIFTGVRYEGADIWNLD